MRCNCYRRVDRSGYQRSCRATTATATRQIRHRHHHHLQSASASARKRKKKRSTRSTRSTVNTRSIRKNPARMAVMGAGERTATSAVAFHSEIRPRNSTAQKVGEYKRMHSSHTRSKGAVWAPCATMRQALNFTLRSHLSFVGLGTQQGLRQGSRFPGLISEGTLSHPLVHAATVLKSDL